MTDKAGERLELYKTYVETATKTTETRLKINTFFVSINTVIIGSSGYINSSILLIFGIAINLLWVELIVSCKLLNKAKFKVIHEIEDSLCHQCFHKEEHYCKEDNMKSFANIEKKIPYLIMILYTVMIFYMNLSLLKSLMCYCL